MPVLSFTQPPHQQTFALGDSLTPDALRIQYKRTYTVMKDKYEFAGDIMTRHTEQKYETSGSPAESGPPIFLWGDQNDARFILADIWAADVIDVLRDKMPSDFTDAHMTSAVAAFQLGTPIYRFVLGNTRSLDSLIPSENSLDRPRGLQLLGPMRNSGARDGGNQQLEGLMVSNKGFPLRAVAKQQPPHSLKGPEQLPFFPVPTLRALPPHFCRPAHVRARTKAVRLPTRRIQKRQFLTADDESEADGEATRAKFGFSLHAISGSRHNIQADQHAQDLVFGVQRSDDASLPKDYWIKQITISVPRGPRVENPDVPANLMDDYNGPGPTMLSNLRFNVLAESTDDLLILRIVPRSAVARKVGVHIDRVRECGFLLPLVDVHDLKLKREITVKCEEHWVKKAMTINTSFVIDLLPSAKVP